MTSVERIGETRAQHHVGRGQRRQAERVADLDRVAWQSSRRQPTCCSSRLIFRLIVAWDVSSASAARVKLPKSTTRMVVDIVYDVAYLARPGWERLQQGES